MRYPRAYAGVKKIFIAEILELIGSVLTSFGAVSAVAGAAGASAGMSSSASSAFTLGGVSLAIPGLIILLVGEVLMLVGLKQAGDDEPQYLKKAFYAAIAMVVVSVVSSFFSNSGAANYIAVGVSLIQGLVTIFVFIYTIAGFNKLAAELGGFDGLISFGRKVMYGLTIGLIANLIASVLGRSNAGVIVAGIAAIIMLVIYIAYLVYLSKAKRMLE